MFASFGWHLSSSFHAFHQMVDILDSILELRIQCQTPGFCNTLAVKLTNAENTNTLMIFPEIRGSGYVGALIWNLNTFVGETFEIYLMQNLLGTCTRWHYFAAAKVLPNLFVSLRRNSSFAFRVSFFVCCSSKQLSRRLSCFANNSLAGGMTTEAIFCSKRAWRFSAYFFRNCGTAFSSLRCSFRIRNVRVFAYPVFPGYKCLSKRSGSPGYSMASITL